jgi:putative membrane protein
MNTKRMCIAVLGTAALLLPAVLAAQTDPSASSGGSPFPSASANSSSGPASMSPNGPQVGSPGAERESLGAPGQSGQQLLDKQFVRAAAESGIADVKLATLATQKGGPDVKEMAQKMLDDHTAMNKDMAAVADSMGVMLPRKMGKDDQAESDKLNGLSGKDFDTEYLTYIVKAHWQNLHSFYMEASVAADPELQSEVVKSLMMMHQHLGLIAKAAAAEGITLPPRPPRPAATTAAK